MNYAVRRVAASRPPVERDIREVTSEQTDLSDEEPDNVLDAHKMTGT